MNLFIKTCTVLKEWQLFVSSCFLSLAEHCPSTLDYHKKNKNLQKKTIETTIYKEALFHEEI